MTASTPQLFATVLFYLFAAITGGGAIGVVVSRNIVRTAVCLLLALIGVAGLYMLLDAEFLAAVQLVVYVGGTLILIVFGVMLTSASQFARFALRRGELAGACVLGTLLLAALIVTLLRTHFPSVVPPQTAPGVSVLGQALLGPYLVPFELASVVLLVVLIGSAYLARGRFRPRSQKAQDRP